MLIGVAFHGNAMSFALDSIAEWGKFPRFCVKTYRWGDKFFNSYDSTFVKGTGYKMNVKTRINNWFDNDRFLLDGDTWVEMRSPATNTIGFDITYLAVSLGYDFNINKIFGGTPHRKSKFNFDFNCALFSASLYAIRNNSGMNLKRVGDLRHINEHFDGVNSSSWGIDAVYFFNNKRYSHAAGFAMSKLQLRSQGSFFVGFSYDGHDLAFDFSKMPDNLKPQLPEDWQNSKIEIKENTYGIKGGYGYNWVPCKHLTIGVSESIFPALSFSKQDIEDNFGTRIRFYNRLYASIVWNKNRWFGGAVAKTNVALVTDGNSVLATSLFSFEFKLGWRFNIW